MTMIGLFLGAGASKLFDFPTSKDLINFIDIDNHPYWEKFVESSPSKDMEELLQHCEKIQESVDSLCKHAFFKRFHHQKKSNREPNLEIKYEFISVSKHITNFQNEVLDLLVKQFDKQKITKEKLDQSYLPLIKYFTNGNPVLDIFTTNYDSVIEDFWVKNDHLFYYNEGVENDGRINPDAIPRKISPGNNPLLNLFKLHGSLDWFYPDLSDQPKKIRQKSEFDSVNNKKRTLILPILGKKTKDHPFLREIFRHYEELIMKYEIFVIIGFSFRDEDISELIRNRINENKQTTIIISPNADYEICKNLYNNVGTDPNEAYISQICQELQQHHSNFHVIKKRLEIDSTYELISEIEKCVTEIN